MTPLEKPELPGHNLNLTVAVVYHFGDAGLRVRSATHNRIDLFGWQMTMHKRLGLITLRLFWVVRIAAEVPLLPVLPSERAQVVQ